VLNFSYTAKKNFVAGDLLYTQIPAPYKSVSKTNDEHVVINLVVPDG
jgi:hypothetical protein